jgi:subtilisin family serine protease
MRYWFQCTIGAIVAAACFGATVGLETPSTPVRTIEPDQVAVAPLDRALLSRAGDMRLARASVDPQTSANQYVRDKLQLVKAHRMARGNKISVAIIDSEIDTNHPDLSGAAIEQYDPTGVEHAPHPHGTGIAGAIASQHKLMGVAPESHILAIRVFAGHGASDEASLSNILKGLDWAVRNNVRIINMSFTGPRDARLAHALKVAHDKGVILIAAVGNGGPDSPPLFPAADPHVIAVTATDSNDRLFAGASRGAHVAIAAPGVDVLVPAPNAGYQLTTGTSIAAAHVTGVVALMLERNPNLTSADVRRILSATAKPLGPSASFGAGLVDPVRAIQRAGSTMVASVR